MKIAFPLAATAAALTLSGCETFDPEVIGGAYDHSHDVYVEYTAEGFNSDRFVTYHNGSSRTVCVKTDANSPGGWLLPAGTHIHRPGVPIVMPDPLVTSVASEMRGCLPVSP